MRRFRRRIGVCARHNKRTHLDPPSKSFHQCIINRTLIGVNLTRSLSFIMNNLTLRLLLLLFIRCQKQREKGRKEKNRDNAETS